MREVPGEDSTKAASVEIGLPTYGDLVEKPRQEDMRIALDLLIDGLEDAVSA